MQPKPNNKVNNPRRGRPEKSYISSLHKIKKVEWEALTSATILAMFEKRYSVFLRVSYLLKFPEGFPTHKVVEKDGLENVVKIRTKTLMRWLIKNGHTTVSMYDIQQAARNFTMSQNKLDSLFQDEYNCTDGVESCEELFLNEHEGEDSND